MNEKVFGYNPYPENFSSSSKTDNQVTLDLDLEDLSITSSQNKVEVTEVYSNITEKPDDYLLGYYLNKGYESPKTYPNLKHNSPLISSSGGGPPSGMDTAITNQVIENKSEIKSLWRSGSIFGGIILAVTTIGFAMVMVFIQITNAGLKSDINTNRTELKAEINTNRSELKAEINTNRTELHAAINNAENRLRNEVAKVDKALKDEMVAVEKRLKNEVIQTEGRINDKLKDISSKLDVLLNKPAK